MKPLLNPIPSKPAEKWREFRIKGVPVIVFVLLLAGVTLFWTELAFPSRFPGQVETIQVEISSPDGGLLTNLWVERFQAVKAGDLIATVNTPLPKKVTSTIEGTVTAIHRRAGEQIGAGEAIATITSTQTDRIIGYLPSSAPFTPRVGMEVEVQTRQAGRTRGVGKIVGIAPNLVQVTNGYAGKNASYAIGRPVSISLPREMNLLPGQDVDLTIRPNGLAGKKTARLNP